MNKFILSSIELHGEYKKALGLYDYESLMKLCDKLENMQAERLNAGISSGDSLEYISNLLKSLEFEISDTHANSIIINNLDCLKDVFYGEYSKIQMLEFILGGMLRDIAEMLDDNIRYGFYDTKELCDLRDFLLTVCVRIDRTVYIYIEGEC